MRKFLTASIFILTFCVFAFGQDKKNSSCPTITVTEISELVPSRREVIFKANLSFNVDKVEYFWSADDGVMTGQGTDTITVRANPDTIEFYPTVTVDIKGLAEGCENSESETAVIICSLYATKIDEFEISKTPIDPERLDWFVAELENNLSDQGYIFIYSGKKFSQSEVKQKENFIVNYLLKKNILSDRLIILNARNKMDDNRIVFWRVPPGATPPTL